MTVHLPGSGLRRLKRLGIFFLASGRVTADMRRVGSEGEGRAFHPHHLVGDAVCLMLKRILGLSDNRPPLNDNRG